MPRSRGDSGPRLNGFGTSYVCPWRRSTYVAASDVMTTAPSSLIGYAVLRANFNAAAPSYLDNFSPFVLDVMADVHPTVMDEHQAAAAVRGEFGLMIPDRVVGVLLKRSLKTGHTVRSNGGFVATDALLGTATSITTDMARFRRQQHELVEKYEAFVRHDLPEHRALLEQNPEEQLSDFIGRHAVPLLRQAVKGGPGTDPETMRGSDYAVSRFIARLSEHDNTAFGYVEEAVKGAFLAAVVDRDTSRFKQSLKDVTILLDTPVLLKALGYQGETQQRAVEQTLQLARVLGG